MGNTKAETSTTQNDYKFGVLYFGWPNQPSSGTTRIYIGRGVYLVHGNYVIPEIRKTNLIDSVKFQIEVAWTLKIDFF